MLLISAPLHPELWTSFDDFVGHKRRYEPPHLLAKLAQHHLSVLRSAVVSAMRLGPVSSAAASRRQASIMPLI